jgi:hypothetical protein
MTRVLSTCCTVGGLLLLTACSSPSTDSATTRNPATGSGGSTGKGGAAVGGNSGSGGQGATGTGGTGGVGTGGASTGGAGTGGTGTAGAGGGGGGKAGSGGTGAGGSSGSGGTTAGSGGSGGTLDGGSTGGTAGTPGTDAGRDASGGGSADARVDITSTDARADIARTDAGATTFSFFVASMKALQTLSGKTDGFGGDFRFGQTDGLTGADEVCRQTAEMGMPGAGNKTWRAFLSATKGPGGTAVNARDRIGPGPWHDRNGRLLAANVTDLFAGARPVGDAMLVNDMTNERGEPNHYVGAGGYTPGSAVDNHDTLTGSDAMGQLRATTMADTCNDWTSTSVVGKPYIGHSWPRSASSGMQWASDHTAPGCAPGLDKTLGGAGTGPCVGCSGGYGGVYCFAVP